MIRRFFVQRRYRRGPLAASWPRARVAGSGTGGLKSPAAAKAWTQGRTPWGDPDLQGVWTSDSENGVPFERPEQFAGKPARRGRGTGSAAGAARGRSATGARPSPAESPAPAPCTGTRTGARNRRGRR